MILDEICPPAIIYIAFSLTHIVIDIFKKLYNTAFLKFVVMIIFTLLLNILCQQGLDAVSWIIVFVPFILMTVITTMLLFVFKLSPSEGGLKYNVRYPSSKRTPYVKRQGRRRERRIDRIRRNIRSEPSSYHDEHTYHKPSDHPDVYEEDLGNGGGGGRKRRRRRRREEDVKDEEDNNERERRRNRRRGRRQGRPSEESEYGDGDYEWPTHNNPHRNHNNPRSGKSGRRGKSGKDHGPTHPQTDKCKHGSCNDYMDCKQGLGYCNTCSGGQRCCGSAGGRSGCLEE